jgi:hypothetical protein
VRVQIAVPEEHVSPEVIDAALEAVTRMNESMIRSGDSPTSQELIDQGAVWRPEPFGEEHFDHGGTIANRGWGDCDDWAPLAAASLRASGQDPGATARVIPSGPNTYHAIVQRSDGSLEDPSIAAGMKAQRIGQIDDERLSIWACDPHDGRIYEGQLAPTVAPMTLHCGPALAVRGATIVGFGNVFEGRCDLPISGSPLVRVRSHLRHRPHHHHHHKHVRGVTSVVGVGEIPYAFSCTAQGPTPLHALSRAIVGAILLGDAAEMTTSLDRYKLLAAQAAMAGMSAGQVHEALLDRLAQDLHAHGQATGTDPGTHSAALLTQLAQEQGTVQGCVIGGFFDDIGKIAGGIVHAVSSVANTVAKGLGGPIWGDILHGVQGAVSAVPILGTAVSEVIAAAETAYEAAAAALSGNPLEGAIHGAYNFALASVPGASALRPALDPVVNSLINMTAGHEPVDAAVLNGLLNSVPDAPKFGKISPRSVAASIAHMVVGHLGIKNASAAASKKSPAAELVPKKEQLVAKKPVAAHVIVKSPPKPIVVVKASISPPPPPPPEAHAAVHVSQVPQAPASAPATSPPPGATRWACQPAGPDGSGWQCAWV